MHHLIPKKKLGASVLVVAVLVVLMINSTAVSWEQVFRGLRQIGVAGLLLALCMALTQYLCLALRFFALLPQARVSLLKVCRVYALGHLLNHAVLARAGDLYKIFAINKASPNRSFGTAHVVSALITERVLATLTLFAMLFLTVDWAAIDFTDIPFGDTAHQLVIGVIVVLLAALALYLAQRKSTQLRHWLRELKTSFFDIIHLPRLSVGLGLSALAWTFEVLSMKFVAAPLHIDLGLGQGILVLLVLNIGIAVPLTLANVGIYEAALVFGLTLWGIEPNQAIAIALCHHALQIAALGIWTAGLNIMGRRPAKL